MGTLPSVTIESPLIGRTVNAVIVLSGEINGVN
jgi:hypothetical protein